MMLIVPESRCAIQPIEHLVGGNPIRVNPVRTQANRVRSIA